MREKTKDPTTKDVHSHIIDFRKLSRKFKAIDDGLKQPDLNGKHWLCGHKQLKPDCHGYGTVFNSGVHISNLDTKHVSGILFPPTKNWKKKSKITEVIEDDRRFLLQLQTHFVDLRLDRAFRGHRGPVTCIAFHPQEQQVHTARYAARVARVCTMLDTDSQIVSVKLHLVACCNICQILFPKVTLKLHKNWNGAILKPGVVLQPLQPRTRLSQALRTDVCSFGSRHGFRQVKFYKRWIQYAHAYTAKILKKKKQNSTNRLSRKSNRNVRFYVQLL